MPNMIKLIPAVIFITLLSGCLSPGLTQKQQTPYPAEIEVVQSAVDQYQEESGVLPIKTRDQETPIYMKYPIEFRKLVPKYLPEPPDNAYESGGLFEYVLVNVEKDPTVKLMDLLIVENVQNLQMQLNIFRKEHGFPPFAEQIVKNRYTIDYDTLRIDEPPFVKSPFTGNDLDFVIDANGAVRVDYRKDLFQYIREHGGDYEQGKDIRDILVEHSPFVPVYSFPYTVNEKDEPVFLIK